MKHFALGTAIFLTTGFLGLSTAQATSIGIAVAEGQLDFSAEFFDPLTFDPVFGLNLDTTGQNSIRASVFARGPNVLASDDAIETFTLTNNSSADASVSVFVTLFSQASSEFFEGGPIETTNFDSNARVVIGTSEAFASTNGTYTCTNPDDTTRGFDCFGLSDFDDDDVFTDFGFFLAAGESRTITLEATAFSFFQSDIAAVPLPATAPMLLLALAGLGWRRAKVQACKDGLTRGTTSEAPLIQD